MQQLFSFIQADINSYRPKADMMPPTDTLTLDDLDPMDDLRFPKSLYLIHPLISTYELNPVAAGAQASVPVPEGLDLDTWIVPPPPEPDSETRANEKGNGGGLEKKKKSKKGKDKAVEPSANGNKRLKDNKEQVVLLPGGDETPEERAARERVWPV